MIGASKQTEKPEKTGRRSKVVPSPRKNKIKIQVPSPAAMTAGASTRTSSSHEGPFVEMNDDGALTILASIHFRSGFCFWLAVIVTSVSEL